MNNVLRFPIQETAEARAAELHEKLLYLGGSLVNLCDGTFAIYVSQRLAHRITDDRRRKPQPARNIVTAAELIRGNDLINRINSLYTEEI